MTKILFVSGSMPPLRCGVGFYLNRFLDYQKEPVDLLTTKGLNTHKNVSKTFYTPDWKLHRLIGLLRACRRGQYDIIHIQYPTKGYGRNLGINKLPHLLRLYTKSKIVVTLHEYHGSGFLGKLRNFITCLPAHKVFVSNPYDLRSLPSVIRNKTIVVPIGSSIPVANKNPGFFNTILKRSGFSSKEKVVSFFGFAYANKGVDLAIQAAKEGGFQLLLLTEFDESDEHQVQLSEQVKQAVSGGAKIYVTGFLEDKQFSEAIQACDYFLLPQPLPLTAKSSTAITAATHKLIVISKAADDPELNSPYVNGKNAVLLKDMNVQSLIKAVNDAPSKTNLKTELDKLAKEFDWEDIATKHQQAYRELI